MSDSPRTPRRVLHALTAVLALALLTVAMVGCTGAKQDQAADKSPAPKATDVEGSWKLQSFGGVEKLEPSDPTVTTTIEFKGGKATGNGGVNSFGSTYEAGEGTLKFGPINATKMAGSYAANGQETAFFSAMEKVRTFEIVDGKLVLSGNNNDTLLVLVKQ